MIQSIVEAPAFQIAHQYLTENRVRIVEADDHQISAVVIGNSGVYEQIIRLKDGMLGTKCSCPLSEQPLCRHSVAVLLEYHRWAKPKEAVRPHERSVHVPPASPQPQSTSTLDLKFSEVTVFIEWFQAAAKALERNQPLPCTPAAGGIEVTAWVHVVQALEDRRRTSEGKKGILEAHLRDSDAQLDRLTQQLQSSIQEAKEAKTASQTLQQELDSYSGLLARLSDLARDTERCDGQIKSMAGDFIKQASQLDALSSSFKEVSAALQGLAKHHGR